MKQIKLFSVVLLLATMFIGFTACSDDDDDKKKEENLIVGKWKLITYTDEIEYFIFKTDGIMTWGDDDSIHDYARYKIKGNILYLLWSDSDVIENESKEWWNKDISDEWDSSNIEIKDDVLTLKYENSKDSYRRVK